MFEIMIYDSKQYSKFLGCLVFSVITGITRAQYTIRMREIQEFAFYIT